MTDVYSVRADESKHREVNHTLGNLNQKEDPNPYASEYKDSSKPHPSKDHLDDDSTYAIVKSYNDCTNFSALGRLVRDGV